MGKPFLLPIYICELIGDLGKRMTIKKGSIHDLVNAMDKFIIPVIPEEILKMRIRIHMTFFPAILKVQHRIALGDEISQFFRAHRKSAFSFLS